MSTCSTPQLEPGDAFETATCVKHGDFQRRILSMLTGMEPIRSGCPACLQDERAERDACERERQKAYEQQKTQSILDQAGVPARFRGATFDDYIATTPAQERVRAAVMSIEQRSREQPGTSAIFIGGLGAGKTMAAICAGHMFAKNHRSFRFMTVLQMVRSIKSTYAHKSELSESQAFANLLSPDLLILDEVGVQLGSHHESTLVWEVLNQRYAELRSTILISNLNLEALTPVLGERLIDRYRECGVVLAFDWPSYRKRAA